MSSTGKADFLHCFDSKYLTSFLISETKMACSKFQSLSCNFITATDAISASDMITYLKERMLNGEFAQDSIFYMISGNHHGKDQHGNVVMGHTDAKLTQGFYTNVFSSLMKIEGSTEGTTLWDEKGYDNENIMISCSEKLDDETCEVTYELSDLSKRDLKKLAR